MDIEVRADYYEEEQKLSRVSYLLDQLTISQEDYNFLKEYDERLVVDFEKDPYYQMVQSTDVPISEGGDFHSEIVGYNYFNNGFEFKENLY